MLSRLLSNAALLVALTGLGAGCKLFGSGDSECKPPHEARVHFQAGPTVNQNSEGQSTATEVRILQLSTLTVLEKKLAQEVFADTTTALEDTLLGEDVTYVQPDSFTTEPVRVELNDKARFIVLVGVFKAAKGNVWRAIYELPRTEEERCEASDTLHMRYELERYQISGGVVRKG